ncbi:MAG: serine hydrolase [Plesiomonas sp.]|uniref:serine hydrolase n=1 Tax=Plesiomonas sp. TaxID=2486279 RepID=UPI003F3B56A8
MKLTQLAKSARLLLLSTITVTASYAFADTTIPVAPSIAAKSYILIDYNSGKVLAERDADMKILPASLTKMMTSYVIGREIKAGKISPDDVVIVSKNAWSKNYPDSSKMFIEVGKPVKVADLNRGIIIQSGNDACVAMSEHVAGSEDSFADMMNKYAKELGMNNSHFMNPHGLDNPDQYSTARDLATLGAALIRDVPDEYAVYKEKSFTYNGITQPNRNLLLWDKSLNVDGIKTGHTSAAGFNLVSSATEGQMRLVAAVIGTSSSQQRAAESKKLLTWGFRFFETIEPLKADREFTKERVWFGNTADVSLGVLKNVYITIPRGRVNDVKARFELDKELKAPLTRGDVVGKVFFQLDGKDIDTQPLVVLKTVEEGGLFSRLTDYITLLFHRWFG